MNLLAQSTQDPGTLFGNNPVMNFIQDCFSDPIFIFFAGIVLLGLFFWYLSSDDDKIKRNAGTFFILGISTFSLFSLFTQGIRYGIDIDGGVSFTLQIQPNIIDGKPEPLTSQAMEQACMTISQRLDSTGANEITVMPQGQDKIQIQIPETDPEKIKEQRELITKIAHLEILPVHPENDRLLSEGIERVPGYQLYDYEFTTEAGKKINEKLFLTKRVLLTGKDIKSAFVDESRRGYISVTLSNDGAEKMWNATREMTKGHDRLAIVLDGRVISAPVVQDNLSKDFSISGLDRPGEAYQLARTLTNPLSNELKILEERQVSASLGKAALVQSEWAGVAGLIVCFILVALYYRFAGIVAMVGLTINGLILLGLMSLFGFVLTLPGIAGIVLTLGMAVDSNVLINERLREEKEKGNTFSYALRKSYEKAFSAIFDSNITSLITAVILYLMASGTIKGFSVTLIIGIVSSMIGAIVVTRVLFHWMEKTGLLNNMQFLNLFKNVKKIDFLSRRKIFLGISLVCIIGSIAAAFIKKEDCLGIDFTGGTSITYDIPNGVQCDFKEVEKLVASQQLTQTATVQEFSTPTGDSIIIRCAADQNDIAKIKDVIAKNMPQIISPTSPSVDMVGAILGEEFLTASLWAILAGLVGIMIYMAVRFEWTFAVAAVIALVHDVVLVLGVIIVSGAELNIIHVGAILTIAGYAVNDTIVIFDRIREQLRYADPGKDEKEMMNDAINFTLSRTVLTSGSTLGAVICLYLFGGPAMRDFSATIFSGILIGTYASICVAPACVFFFTRKHSLHEEVQRTVEAELGNTTH